MATIELRSLSKRFGTTEVIPRIDLTIPDGRVTVLLGPSGCGKSTLLRMIAGLETPSDGEICIDGAVVNQVAPSKRGCAMVFQNYALYPNKTVRHNLSFPLRMAKVPQAEQDRLVERTAHTLELTPLLDRFPRQLSGGQRQRVAMGRAMIRQPKVFLYDEPLSNLDLELRVKLRMEIARMQKSLKATAVYVTHDQTEAMTLADQIVVLRKGHIEQVGAPLDLYRKPVNLFVAGFIGTPRINLFAVDSVQYNGTATKLRMGAGGIEVQRRFTTAPKWVGFRPEQVSWATANPGQVVFALNDCETQGVEHLGDRAFCYLSSHMGEVVVLARSAEEQFSGSLRIAVDESALHFFGEDGVALV